MINRKQFPKARKKRAVDPNAPPRPNLLSQDKKLRQTMGQLESHQTVIAHLKQDLQVANRKIRYLETQVSTLFGAMRGKRTSS